jgi:hypothetical protein
LLNNSQIGFIGDIDEAGESGLGQNPDYGDDDNELDYGESAGAQGGAARSRDWHG